MCGILKDAYKKHNTYFIHMDFFFHICAFLAKQNVICIISSSWKTLLHRILNIYVICDCISLESESNSFFVTCLSKLISDVFGDDYPVFFAVAIVWYEKLHYVW